MRYREFWKEIGYRRVSEKDLGTEDDSGRGDGWEAKATVEVLRETHETAMGALGVHDEASTRGTSRRGM